jgi:hypothetical protein
MTRTTPRLRKILHLSQIVLTDARTFILYSHIRMRLTALYATLTI